MTAINVDQAQLKKLQALANANRLQIMVWILTPRDHFEAQIDGDLVDDGVCVGRIVDKIGLSQPTVTAHMKVLADAGLVTSKKIKTWVFYKPVRTEIQPFLPLLETATR